MSDLLEFVNHSNSGYLLNANEGKKLREDGQPANGSLSFCQSISEVRDSRDLCVSLGPVLEEDASRYQLIRYRKAANIAHCEYAALLVKNSSLQTESQQFQSQLVTKETSLQEMKSELEIYKENNTRPSSKIQTLKAQVKELEEIATSVTRVKSQSGAYIYTLKRKNQELSERVSELEKHLRMLLVRRENAEQKAASLDKKLAEVTDKLSSSMNIDIKGQEDPLGFLVIKEKDEHMGFLQELTEKLQINQVSSPESLHCQYEMLLDKAEQLSKLDTEYLIANKNCIFNLQKVNSQREKIKMKTWQIEQLTEKIKQFEKGKEQQVCLNTGQDPQSLKAQKESEKLQELLSEMKMSNQTLQAKFVSVNDIKNKTIKELSKSLEKFEKIKEKAARKVVNLKTELDYTEHEARKEKERAHHMLEAVTNELHIAKRALEEVARREKQ
ncbi:unnamed protein product [Eretmochelys imbricata]